MSPVYEVSTILRPVALKELDAYNRANLNPLTPEQALRRIGGALESYEIRRSYFFSSPELQEIFSRPGQTPDQAFQQFSTNALSITQPDPRKGGQLSSFIGVRMTYSGKSNGAEILNGFVAYALQAERRDLQDGLGVLIENRLIDLEERFAAARDAYKLSKSSEMANLLESDSLKRALLQDELNALRVQLKSARESRIAALDEAIVIAKQLGLQKTANPAAMTVDPSRVSSVQTVISNQQMPLYFLGSDALEAERSVLRKRLSDDFADPRVAEIRRDLQLLSVNRKIQILQKRENEDLFIRGVDDIRSEKMRLLSINRNLESLSLAVVDRLAVEPLGPIKPNKVLFVAIGFIVGGILALLAVVIFHFFQGRRVSLYFSQSSEIASAPKKERV
jgi:LPS O-antigen subunit length determinant protein (WzzB/FepE family)